MSTHYQVRCIDCNEEGGIWINRGSDEAQFLAENGALFKAIGLKMVEERGKHRHVPLTISLCDFAREGYTVDLDFFVAHGDHRLVAVDEYGRDFG